MFFFLDLLQINLAGSFISDIFSSLLIRSFDIIFPIEKKTFSLEQATAPENRGDYQFNGISFTGQFLHEEATNRYDCFPNRKDDWRMFQVSIRTIDITVGVFFFF